MSSPDKPKVYLYTPEDEYHSIHEIIGIAGLYQGNVNATKEKVLEFHNIKAIVNAANYYNYYTGVSRDVAESRGIKTLEISVLDADEHKDVIYAQFDKVADFINEHISQGNNVLVHCAAGVSRSSTLTLSYLIKHHKLPLSKAYDILVSSRKIACPNDGFWVALSKWEKEQLGNLPDFTPSPLPAPTNWDF